MITKSGIDTKNFEFESAGVVRPEFYMSYTSKEPTGLFVLTNNNGAEACITNVGARLVSLMVPDASGTFQDVVLGYDNLAGYLDTQNGTSNFQGAIIGRYANRIASGQFEINGNVYNLPINDNTNCLHGGHYGWCYQTFSVVKHLPNSITLKLVAPDGEMNFPGKINFVVTYSLFDDNSLHVNYSAETDAPTVINVTNHSYFNLNGDHSKNVLNHQVFINSRYMTPINSQTCPTGEISKIRKNSPFDFYGKCWFSVKYLKSGKVLGKDISADDPQIKLGNGYDHNFVLQNLRDSRKARIPSYYNQIPLAARVYSPRTGIKMEVFTDQPGMQLYDSVDLDGSTIGKRNIPLMSCCGLCLETQHFADSPHNPQFPTTELWPDDKFQSVTIYKFS